MKLSAPPPPPPPPPEPPAPNPDGGDPAAGTPPTPPATPAAPNPATPPATWPQWFATADALLAALAVSLAFLVASFAARNSDVWPHLAAGKRLLAGEYKLGSDPFSYAAADRAWVNHSWLWDLGAYLLYRGDGLSLVLAKAMAVAVAALLLLAICRPSFSLWPWVLCVVLAALAAAPRLTLGPQAASVLFLAATLFLVFRLPSPPGSWRLPLWIGGTFWLWANCDQWFFLGPLAVALLLVGELVQKQLGASGEAGGGPLTLPDTGTLARALLVGIVACMVNPHHVRVWTLPVEVTGSEAVAADPELRLLLLSPLDATFCERSQFGFNQNGFAYAALLVGGSLSLLVGGRRGREAQIALWVGFALLSLRTVAAIPFFAAVAVPVVAGRLNFLTARAELGTRADPHTRVLLTAGTAGRVFGVLALAGLCVAAWPGWLHPTPAVPADVARVAWAVEPDPSLVRAAAEVERWRADGRLPADARGVALNMGVANTMAWFAPHEKVLLNSRYSHHREELAGLVALRAALVLRPGEDEAVRKVLGRYGASYLLLYDRYPRYGPNRPAVRLASDPAHWSEWYTDGRAQVFGWRDGPKSEPAWFDALRVDPGALAFGPGVARLPEGRAEFPAPPPSWADEFVRPPRPSPPEADEALGWVEYQSVVSRNHQFRTAVGRVFAWPTPLPQGASFHQFAIQDLIETNRFPNLPVRPADFLAPPILAVRAARRAIAANPDHPDGYYALARSLADPNLRITDAEREVGMVTAYRQCLIRLPGPEEYRSVFATYGRRPFAASPMEVARVLAELYLGGPGPNNRPRGITIDAFPLAQLAGEMQFDRGQRRQVPFVLPLDLARETFVLAGKYAEIELPALADADLRKQFGDQLKAEQKAVEDLLRGELTRYDQAVAAAGDKFPVRYLMALQHHLTDKALGLVKGKGADLAKEFGPSTPEALLQMVALELCVGRLEEAARDVADLKELFDERAKKGETDERFEQHRFLLRHLELQKLTLEGNYAAAGKLLEDLEGGAVGADRALAELQKIKFDPKAFGLVRGVWPLPAMLGAASPLEALTLFMAGSEQINRYESVRGALRQRMAADADFFFRRGFLSLLEGDVESAKVRFRQTTREAPPGWNLPPYRYGPAADYLNLIEAAERKP